MVRFFVFLLLFLSVVHTNFANQSYAQVAPGKLSAQPELKKYELTEDVVNDKLLAISRTYLDTKTTNIGEPFSAKVVENLIVGENIVVPSGSILTGQVIEVRRPGIRPINKNGQIKVSINQLETPDGQIISLAGREINGLVISQYAKTLQRRVVERIPTLAVTNGTSIPLNEATDLNGGVVYAISTGARAVTGFMTGLIAPEPGRTRIASAFRMGAFETPIGTAYQFLTPGYDVQINSGDSIVFSFDEPTIAKIQEQYTVARASVPTVVAR
ncbi:MAG: hypothetical protein ACD_20C00402G0018 [uncultured bacterium]|nr:MAG: hypothetical protein ACD_20C00402G0018 [uncultured bacterium]HBH18235.1 hypothetical protein [Cyanobacteria bacterium UBA9579]